MLAPSEDWTMFARQKFRKSLQHLKFTMSPETFLLTDARNLRLLQQFRH